MRPIACLEISLLHSDCQNGISNSPGRVYTTAGFPANPRGQSGQRPEIIALSKKRSLTREQERRRIEGLSVLARIIARHYLEHPDLYPQPVDGGEGRKESGQEVAE